MRDPICFLQKEYQELVEKALDWRLKELQDASEPVTMVDGREVLVLCSNNYRVGASHPELKQAAAEAIEIDGVGSIEEITNRLFSAIDSL